MACSRRHASVSLMACSSPVAIARSVSRSGVSLAGAVAAEGKDPAKAAKIPAAACQAYRTAPGASLAGRCGKSRRTAAGPVTVWMKAMTLPRPAEATKTRQEPRHEVTDRLLRAFLVDSASEERGQIADAARVAERAPQVCLGEPLPFGGMRIEPPRVLRREG